MPGRRVRVLSDYQHPHIREWRRECAKHLGTARQVSSTGGRLGAQEVTEAGDFGLCGGERFGPPRVEEFVQRLWTHSTENYAVSSVTGGRADHGNAIQRDVRCQV
jgi:hypothetical protein